MKSKRLRFFLGHLSVSALVLSLAAFLIFLVWYPVPLASATKVIPVFLMLLLVDVVLGPFCSLLVYKEGKKSLKFDLSVIIIIQVAAFVYGLHSLAVARPVWIVFYKNSFDLIRANELDQTQPDKIPVAFKKASWTGPQFVAVEPSKDIPTYKKDVELELAGTALSQRPERYLTLSLAAADIRANLQDISILYNFNQKQRVDNLLSKYPAADSWLALERGAVDKVVLMNREKAEPVKIVDLSPWDK